VFYTMFYSWLGNVGRRISRSLLARYFAYLYLLAVFVAVATEFVAIAVLFVVAIVVLELLLASVFVLVLIWDLGLSFGWQQELIIVVLLDAVWLGLRPRLLLWLGLRLRIRSDWGNER
jgi:hypothetical protein